MKIKYLKGIDGSIGLAGLVLACLMLSKQYFKVDVLQPYHIEEALLFLVGFLTLYEYLFNLRMHVLLGVWVKEGSHGQLSRIIGALVGVLFILFAVFSYALGLFTS